MQEHNPTQTRFFKKWSIQRKNKWRYIFIHGSVFWGLPVAITFILTEKVFKAESLTLLNALITVVLFMAGGLLFGNRSFKRCENSYNTLLDEDIKITDGVKILESDKSWSHDNLIFTIYDDRTMIVRNNLFWLKDDQSGVHQADVGLQVLLDDVTRLRANKALGAYLENRIINFKLFNNEDKANPIAEKYI